MARFIQIDADTWIVYQPALRQSTVVSKSELEAELAMHREQLAALPEPLTNAQLLVWAKANYPNSGFEESRRKLQAEIYRLQTVLENLV